MDQNLFARYLNGFNIGVVFGVVLEFTGITIYNLFCSWQSCTPLTYIRWNFIPLPLLMGVVMSLFVANFTLRD